MGLMRAAEVMLLFYEAGAKGIAAFAITSDETQLLLYQPNKTGGRLVTSGHLLCARCKGKEKCWFTPNTISVLHVQSMAQEG